MFEKLLGFGTETLTRIGMGIYLFEELLYQCKKAYLKTVLKHKWYVLEAGLNLGGIRLSKLLQHDMSKLSSREFEAYRKNFYPITLIEKEENEADFDRAWRAHWSINPHHWEFWTDLGKQSAVNKCSITLYAMPEEYVREMVADWIAASKAYSGSDDMQEWFNKAYPDMALHQDTIDCLRRVLAEINVFLP